MTEKEVIEANKEIALFMGYTWSSEKDGKTYLKESDSQKNIYSTRPEHLNYDKSWNALMPVVEKIESMHHETFPLIVNISGDGAYIGVNGSNVAGQKYEGKREIVNTLNNNYFACTDEEHESKIMGVYKAVLQFIRWYNEQLTSKQ